MRNGPVKRRDGLQAPLQYVKGAGPQRAELLSKLGLATVHDLLYWFPRDYQDFTHFTAISDLQEDITASVQGVVEDIDLHGGRDGKSVLGLLVSQQQNYLRAVWFNQPYIRRRFTIGQRVLLSGKPKRQFNRWEMVQPNWQILGPDDDGDSGEILPIYSLTEGLKQWHLQKLMRNALKIAEGELQEIFPAEFLESEHLLPIGEAICNIHFPTRMAEAHAARFRFVYEELLLLQLAMAVRRLRQRTLAQAPVLECTTKIDARIRRLLSFELTASQREVLHEITADLARPVPMGRLLQGDVGSGKTAVAVYAALVAVAHGYQVAFMAPTEVLAQQHCDTLREMLANSRVRLGVLTGSVRTSDRRRILTETAEGQLDILVGTHALIESAATFNKLGLVVIDEQHKFGVQQRAGLRMAGQSPHYLVMTATPIPRSTALTLFGDLEISVLRELPEGRKPVRTYLATSEESRRWWEFVRKKLRQGRQAYIVTPTIEDSRREAGDSLEETYERLSHGELNGFRLGKLHGRLAEADKHAVMRDFRNRRIQALVCTSIIEVGIDVPNATLMTIEGADRFGLAQLHQLRGRIARGNYPGFCCCFSQGVSDESQKRLEAFIRTTDGFELAELDFRLRGPGDLLGTRQHGLPPLKVADLARDMEILEKARKDARKLVADDPGLVERRHAKLRAEVLARYGKVLDLGDVG